MTREDIIRMAQQVEAEGFAPVGVWPEVYRLCELAYAAGVTAEREACAKVCDEIANKPSNVVLGVAIDCATAIRARGNT